MWVDAGVQQSNPLADLFSCICTHIVPFRALVKKLVSIELLRYEALQSILVCEDRLGSIFIEGSRGKNPVGSAGPVGVTELLDLVWFDLAVRDVLDFPVVGVRNWRKRNDVFGLLVLCGKVFF